MGEMQMIQTSYLEYLKKNYPEYLDHYYKRKEKINFVINEFSSYTEEEYKEQILRKDTIVQSFLEQYVHDCAKENPIPLFNKLEIETINQCNNICSFCPVNKFDDKRVHMTMAMELFKKIIMQLEDLNYADAINLFSNNEPLLDSLLEERIKFAREHLPNAYISIFTNGLLLTPEKLLQLLPYLDFVHINNYNTVPQLLPGHQRLQETLMKNRIPEDKVEIHLRNKSECLSTRGGQAPNRKYKAALYSPCILPFSQMVIRPNGEVSFCCNDAYGLYTMGDASTEALIDIWYGKAFKKSRANMLKNRLYQAPCKDCDMIFMPLACEKNRTKVEVI